MPLAAADSPLLSLLDLEAADVADAFVSGPPATDRRRVFGGAVAGQAVAAAVRTVGDELAPHSLHGYFLRAGHPEQRITYAVERIRDGRSFANRRVVASQEGRVIFHLSCSFQTVEDGPDLVHEVAPEVPGPDDLEPLERVIERFGGTWRPPFEAWRSVEQRYVQLPPEAASERASTLQMWTRVRDPISPESRLHVPALTYISDMTLLASAVTVNGVMPGAKSPFQTASLDHAVWFHRPFRADEWLLYDMHAITNQGARGLCQGRLYTEDGRLVATVMQEGLVRPKREERSPATP